MGRGISYKAAKQANRRDDGLAVCHFADDKKAWWCHLCYGYKPARVTHAQGMDEVFPSWDVHRSSPSHIETAKTFDRVGDLTRLIAKANT